MSESDRSSGRETVYLVVDAGGDYVACRSDCDAEPARTPAADQAHEFETRAEAEAACRRATDRVLTREV